MSDISTIWDATHGDWRQEAARGAAGVRSAFRFVPITVADDVATPLLRAVPTVTYFSTGAGPQLVNGNDLTTAVLISLFTDRVALPEDEIPDATDDPRGWWADDAGQPIGSRLWLIERSKRTQETLSRAQGYIEEALQWLIDDGVVAAFGVEVDWQPQNTLAARVTARRSDGSTTAMNFAWAWSQVT